MPTPRRIAQTLSYLAAWFLFTVFAPYPEQVERWRPTWDDPWRKGA